jgi:hypothetical protein
MHVTMVDVKNKPVQSPTDHQMKTSNKGKNTPAHET